MVVVEEVVVVSSETESGGGWRRWWCTDRRGEARRERDQRVRIYHSAEACVVSARAERQKARES